ncbi:MAG: hypothetical protein ACXVAB_13520, partial [Thermodesulfobacteriota bacterium]
AFITRGCCPGNNDGKFGFDRTMAKDDTVYSVKFFLDKTPVSRIINTKACNALARGPLTLCI